MTFAGIGALAAVLSLGIHVFSNNEFESFTDRFTFSPHPAFAGVNGFDPSTSVADVVDRVLPGVVNISSTRKIETPHSPFFHHPFFREFFGDQTPPERLQRGLGSGVIVDASGIIVTNNHVVAKADDVRVNLPGEKREFKAKILGTDPKSDLAILKLQDVKGVKLKPLALGDSNSLRLGDVVLAIGNPFGVGQTVTMGIVSAKGRANVGIVEYEDFIQTDAAINPGNSGGALVNMKGEVIGINTAILSRSGGYQGIGFAIPTNMAQPIMNSLRRYGKVRRGWLGVVIQNVDEKLAKALKLPTTKGVLISDIDPQGPAAKAGLQRGDLIVNINGTPVESTGRLRNLIAGIGSKGRAAIGFFRSKKKRQITVTLAELPQRLGGTGATGSSEKSRLAGLELAPLTPKERERYELPPRLRYGLVVRGVAPASAAAQAGLRRGDVILEANQVKLKTVGSFSRVYTAAESQVLLLVYRRGSTLFLLLPK